MCLISDGAELSKTVALQDLPTVAHPWPRSNLKTPKSKLLSLLAF